MNEIIKQILEEKRKVLKGDLSKAEGEHTVGQQRLNLLALNIAGIKSAIIAIEEELHAGDISKTVSAVRRGLSGAY